MRKIVVILLLFSAQATAQNNIAHFSFWKPKPGQDQFFENGYKKHLVWHKENGDKWAWYGWYFISGTRAGQFFDATFDHSWSEYDKPVNPAGDNADNGLHTEPFADFVAGMKMMKLLPLSYGDSNGLKTKFLRYITLTISNTKDISKIIERLKSTYQTAGIQSFYTYKTVDGTSLDQLILLIGVNSWEEFGKTDSLFEKLNAIEAELNLKAIRSVHSETLVYRADMSLFP